MLDVLKIPPPALPGGAQSMVIGLVVVVAGLVLLTFGRVVVWRVVSALLLATLGLAIGAAIAGAMNVKPGVPMMIAALVLAALGAALARLWWGLFLGAALACVALLLLIRGTLTPQAVKVPEGFSEMLPFLAWLPKAAGVAGQWLSWLWKHYPMAELVAIALPVILGLVLGLARPAATRILMTCVMGAAAVVIGGCMMLQSARPGLNVLAGWSGWLALLVAVLLAVLGIAFQSRAQVRSGKKTDQEVEAAPPPRRPGGRR